MLGINLEIALPDDHEISTFATCNLLKLLTSLNEKANGNSNGERNITNFKQDHHSSWVSVDPRANEMVDWLRDFTNILPVEKVTLTLSIVHFIWFHKLITLLS